LWPTPCQTASVPRNRRASQVCHRPHSWVCYGRPNRAVNKNRDGACIVASGVLSVSRRGILGRCSRSRANVPILGLVGWHRAACDPRTGRESLGTRRVPSGYQTDRDRSRLPPDYTSAAPFWGFSAMRRWQFLHRSWLRLYAGIGGSYKTEIDTLDATRLNFSYLLAARFDLGASGSLFEIAARHWSNAYIKEPNIGENFLTLSFSY
jgi:hypothetical protein